MANRLLLWLRKKTGTPRGQQISNSLPIGSRTRFDVAIEAVWLIALVLVPLAFSGRDVVVLFLQPKDLVLHAAALSILALWGFDWALGGHRTQLDVNSWTSIRRWLGRNPRNWALMAAAGYGIAVMVSTIVSPLPGVSLWGRDFASLGYEMYSLLSLLVIFFAIALRLRSEQQVRRILWAITGAGVIAGSYGISQHFGWDPIGFGAGQARVIGSFGNPIFFGSYLVMSGTITLGLALYGTRQKDRWWLPLIAAMLAIQLAALWFTGSRGPWIGVAVGLLSFAGMGAFTLNMSNALRIGATVIAGLVMAGTIINFPGSAVEGDVRGIGSIVSGGTPGTSLVGERTDIWEGSLRLIDSWETPSAESRAVSVLRPIFGLGPEMYSYSYPLVANPQQGVRVPSHAHNFPLQVFLELGLMGFATIALLAISILAAGFGFLRIRRRTDDWLAIAMLAVIASLVGRGAEQMVGVARVGDLVVFWALLGVGVAIYGLGQQIEEPARKSERAHGGGRSYYRLGTAVMVSLLLLIVFVLRDVQMVRSGIVASDAFQQSKEGDLDEAINSLQRASDISPDVEHYHVWRGKLLLEKSQDETDLNGTIRLLGDSHKAFLEHEEHDPFAFTTQLNIGHVESQLVNLGDFELRADLIERSLILGTSMSAYPLVQAFAAERLLIAGQLELGLDLADQAIAMEQPTSLQPLAWFMRGNALGELGDVEGALEAFTTALAREPDDQIVVGIHRNMALAYDSIGQTTLATEHAILADQVEFAISSDR